LSQTYFKVFQRLNWVSIFLFLFDKLFVSGNFIFTEKQQRWYRGFYYIAMDICHNSEDNINILLLTEFQSLFGFHQFFY
jgi:hypothetical protein